MHRSVTLTKAILIASALAGAPAGAAGSRRIEERARATRPEGTRWVVRVSSMSLTTDPHCSSVKPAGLGWRMNPSRAPISLSARSSGIALTR